MSLDPTPSDDVLRRMAEQRGRATGLAEGVVIMAKMARSVTVQGRRIVLGPDSPLLKPEKKKRDQPEHREQVRLFQWIDCEQDNPLIRQAYAVPNGGKRGPLTAKKMKAEGVRAGECDINLDVPRGGWCGLRIELKDEDGYTSPGQMARINQHRSNGFAAEVCKGWEAARDLLRSYISLAPTTTFGVKQYP